MTTHAKPRLYLDVDGVLNASHAARRWRTEDEAPDSGYGRGFATSYENNGQGELAVGWSDYRVAKEQTYRITWSTKLIEALKSLDVEIVWCTTWCDDANRSVGPLVGLGGDHRVLYPRGGVVTFPSIYWKSEAVCADQEESPSPFIWIDDEVWDLGSETLLSVLPGQPIERYLLVGPEPNFGVSPQQIEEIRNFLKRVREHNVSV